MGRLRLRDISDQPRGNHKYGVTAEICLVRLAHSVGHPSCPQFQRPDRLGHTPTERTDPKPRLKRCFYDMKNNQPGPPHARRRLVENCSRYPAKLVSGFANDGKIPSRKSVPSIVVVGPAVLLTVQRRVYSGAGREATPGRLAGR